MNVENRNSRNLRLKIKIEGEDNGNPLTKEKNSKQLLQIVPTSHGCLETQSMMNNVLD